MNFGNLNNQKILLFLAHQAEASRLNAFLGDEMNASE